MAILYTQTRQQNAAELHPQVHAPAQLRKYDSEAMLCTGSTHNWINNSIVPIDVKPATKTPRLAALLVATNKISLQHLS